MCTAECVLKKSVRELTPVILGTWETEIRKIKVQGHFKPVSQKFPTRKTPPLKRIVGVVHIPVPSKNGNFQF
jgi:hypothetical protein